MCKFLRSIAAISVFAFSKVTKMTQYFAAAVDASQSETRRERGGRSVCVCVRVCVKGFLTHCVLPPSVPRTGINEHTDGHSLISSNGQRRERSHMRTPADMLTIIFTPGVQIRAAATGDATSCRSLPRTPARISQSPCRKWNVLFLFKSNERNFLTHPKRGVI